MKLESTPLCRDEKLLLSSGELALQYWGDENKPLILCLHGWLDNSASFHLLAQRLMKDYQLLLVDLPGHGLSDPLADGAHYYIWQNIETLYEIMQKLNIERVNLLGHSMGGVVASLFAGTFAAKVNSLVLLDSLGPLASSAQQTPSQLAKAIIDSQKLGSGLRVFADVEQALSARKKSSPEMTDDALRPIVKRNLIKVEGGYSWRTDKRLRHSSKVRLTEDQVQVFLAGISAKVLVIFAERGIVPKLWYKQRLEKIANQQSITLPGHHHFHCEAKSIDAINQALRTFYAGLNCADMRVI